MLAVGVGILAVAFVGACLWICKYGLDDGVAGPDDPDRPESRWYW